MVFQSTSHEYFPQRAGELLEYKESIERMAGVFEWQQVNAYDRHFHRVQEKIPLHPWNLVNQDAKDKHLLKKCDSKAENPKATSFVKTHKNKEGKDKGKKKRELCRRFNQKNQCTFGETCYFDHRCAICGKAGHEAVACRKCMESGKVPVKKEN